MFHSVLSRCGGLSRLRLVNGEMPFPPEVPACGSTMRELCLRRMTVADAFFHNLPALLPFLTELRLSNCLPTEETAGDMHAPSTLRWASFSEADYVYFP